MGAAPDTIPSSRRTDEVRDRDGTNQQERQQLNPNQGGAVTGSVPGTKDHYSFEK
jgi:hypothetical protein